MRNVPLKGLIQKQSPAKHPAVPPHKNPHKKGDVKETPTGTSPGWPKLPK